MDPALHELLGEGEPDDEVAVIIRVDPLAPFPPGIRIVARFGPIMTCRLRRADIPTVRSHPKIISMKAARNYAAPVGPEPAEDEGDDTLFSGPGSGDRHRPERELPTGRGVVVAHIDWGVDFAHPEFRGPDGRTRLLALWDQGCPADPARPNPYGYGRIYSAGDIDHALSAPDPYSALGYDPADADSGNGSHGTVTLSIAAGNGRSGGPLGVAPEADLVFVHFSTTVAEGKVLLGDSVAFLEALDFIAKIAGPRPFVVNASLDTITGPHDFSSLVEQGMDSFLLEAIGRSIVQSCGNYFDRRVHSAGLLLPGQSRTLHIEIDERARRAKQEVDLWYAGTDRLGIRLRGPEGILDTVVPPGERAPLIFGGREIGRLYHRLGDPNYGANELTLFLDPHAPAGVWELRLTADDVVDGRYHAWI